MSAKILVLDPLTLIGREFLRYSERLELIAGEIEYAHTDLDPEHQIAEISSQPGLVPPLADADQLEGYDAVVVASDAISSRHDNLLQHLEDRPDSALLDLSRLAIFDEMVEPSTGRSPTLTRRVRVAHPAVAAASSVVEMLSHLGRLRGSLFAIDPGSAFGREGIDLLVKQAALRLQGGNVEERIFDHVLAFNTVAVDAATLQAEASAVLPDVPLAVSRCLNGSFHGHLVLLGLVFDRGLDQREIEDAFDQYDTIEVTPTPLGLESVPDSDQILTTGPTFSPDGRQANLTLMVDGLRIGGALTALDILEGLI